MDDFWGGKFFLLILLVGFIDYYLNIIVNN